MTISGIDEEFEDAESFGADNVQTEGQEGITS